MFDAYMLFIEDMIIRRNVLFAVVLSGGQDIEQIIILMFVQCLFFL